jgi:flagellar biosynthesis/type III secretory pathway protein FliH
MSKRGRVIYGNAMTATPLVSMLPQEHAATAPAWLERLPAPQPRDLFAPAGGGYQAPSGPSAAEERAQLDAERQQLQAMKQQLVAAQAQWMQSLAKLAAAAVPQAPSAQLVLEVAMAVAKELVGHELQTNKALVLRTLDDLLQSVAGEQQVELRLSPNDLEAVRQQRPELGQQVRLVADPTLGPGGCVVETPRQILDGSIDRRLAAVRAALHELPTANDNGVAEPAARAGAHP